MVAGSTVWLLYDVVVHQRALFIFQLQILETPQLSAIVRLQKQTDKIVKMKNTVADI